MTIGPIEIVFVLAFVACSIYSVQPWKMRHIWEVAWAAWVFTLDLCWIGALMLPYPLDAWAMLGMAAWLIASFAFFVHDWHARRRQQRISWL